MEKTRSKWFAWLIGLFMCLSMHTTVSADSSLSADDLIQSYSGGEVSELIQTQINFKEEVAEHTTGMMDFFLLLLQLIVMVVVIVAVGYGIYLLIGNLLDHFK